MVWRQSVGERWMEKGWVPLSLVEMQVEVVQTEDDEGQQIWKKCWRGSGVGLDFHISSSWWLRENSTEYETGGWRDKCYDAMQSSWGPFTPQTLFKKAIPFLEKHNRILKWKMPDIFAKFLVGLCIYFPEYGRWQKNENTTFGKQTIGVRDKWIFSEIKVNWLRLM